MHWLSLRGVTEIILKTPLEYSLDFEFLRESHDFQSSIAIKELFTFTKFLCSLQIYTIDVNLVVSMNGDMWQLSQYSMRWEITG